MEWSDLRVFLAVARTGTLGQAARSLGQTQPTMGRRLKALEDSVGQTLFQRTSEGFVLTDEGAAILPHAERVEEEVLAMERRLGSKDKGLEGVVRISSSDWFGLNVLLPVLTEFASLHPKVQLELSTDARMVDLGRREADLAFRIRPFEEPDVISRKLLRMRYAVYVRKGLPWPTAGDGDGFGLVTMDAAFRDLPDAKWLREKLPRARVAIASNNRDIQARACAAGAGIAVLPVALGDNMRGLERIDLGGDPPGRDTWVGYHRDLSRLARLRALLALVLERLSRST